MELILTWVIKAEHTGVGVGGGVVGGEYLGDPGRAHRSFNKKLHRHPAPSAPESVISIYCYPKDLPFHLPLKNKE